ncbi:uncharacterized protein [Argopecten irradians]|uniref:uncharacterized protein n=1 Tax=Argopecten irradians TaxID=31199 RepID=UPI0037128E88
MGCSVSTPDPPIPPVLQPRSKNVKRKAFVIIRPWTNEEQNKWFSNIHIDKSEEYVSRTFNIEVREIKNSTTEVNSRLATETDTTPSDMFKFQYNSEQLNEVVYIHSGIDITSECGKTHDFIKLSMEVRIVKNHVIYTLHQYNGTEWIKTEIEQKAGQATVEVDMYEIVTTETIFFTMRYISEEITIPPQGYEHENEYCRNQRITFQEGAVGDNKQLGITTLSLEDECDQKRL